MVWSANGPDGKPRYIKRFGRIAVISRDSKNALDNVPLGWEVTRLPSGHLKLRKSG